MKPLPLFLALAVLLPKAEMPFEGMIVRCNQAQYQIDSSTGYIASATQRKIVCHWECEFGPTFETRIKDGVQESVQTGCNKQSADLKCLSWRPCIE